MLRLGVLDALLDQVWHAVIQRSQVLVEAVGEAVEQFAHKVIGCALSRRPAFAGAQHESRNGAVRLIPQPVAVSFDQLA
jgi:hypothetical protein